MKRPSDGTGRRLKQARAQRQLTMDQLASKAKISQSAISVIESGQRNPTTQTIENLAWALEVDPAWLAYGTGNKPDWDK